MTDGAPPVEADLERRVLELVSSLSDRELISLVSGDEPVVRGAKAMGVRYNPTPIVAGRLPSRGIEGVAFTDGPRGVVMGNCTAFPVPMARGASFDPHLEERIGDAIGVEGRTLGANLFAGVCINLLRHPAWGRAQETYGEDSHLLGEMGAALVRGSQRHLMACIKHYACNSMENSRFWVDVRIDEADLRDLYLPHFRRCVDEGAAAVMSSYNRVNGDWCGSNRHLLTEILKNEWGFDGFVMSDFMFGVRGSAPRSLEAGLDLEMPFEWRFKRLRIDRGRRSVTRARITDAATRLLRQQERHSGRGEPERYRTDAIACADHRDLAERAAIDSLVLLANDGALPLRDEVRTLGVIGKLAGIANTGDLGSSLVHPPHVVTMLDGLQALAANRGVVVEWISGDDPHEAAALARRCDAVVVAVGNTFRDEGEWIGRAGGDRRSLRLRPADERLVSTVGAANPRTAVVLYGGSAFITEEWRHHVGAILMAWSPGMEGGSALAKVLFGDEVPGGRLPCSWPASSDDLPPFSRFARRVTYGPLHGYRMHEANGTNPAFAFGFGLGYSTVEHGPAELVDVAGDGRTATVSMTVRNTGSHPAVEVVQAYVPEALGTHRRTLRTLRGFSKVRLEPGGATTVQLDVPIQPGATSVWVGTSSRPEDLAELTLDAPHPA